MSSVISINIASQPAGPTTSIDEVRAVPGRGLEGDRYYLNTGTFSKEIHEPDSELTLVESEQVEAFNEEHGTAMTPADTRRNIVTRGISLNDLEGREFTIGEVRLRGMELCEPCAHLARLTDERVLPGLVHKAGLRAQILSEGVIRVGDVISAM